MIRETIIMENIDINTFAKLVIYTWVCPTCLEGQSEVSKPEDLEHVFCESCGNTFKIKKD